MKFCETYFMLLRCQPNASDFYEECVNTGGKSPWHISLNAELTPQSKWVQTPVVLWYSLSDLCSWEMWEAPYPQCCSSTKMALVLNNEMKLDMPFKKEKNPECIIYIYIQGLFIKFLLRRKSHSGTFFWCQHTPTFYETRKQLFRFISELLCRWDSYKYMRYAANPKFV